MKLVNHIVDLGECDQYQGWGIKFSDGRKMDRWKKSYNRQFFFPLDIRETSHSIRTRLDKELYES